MISVSVYVANYPVLDWSPAGKRSNAQKYDMTQSSKRALQVKSNIQYTLNSRNSIQTSSQKEVKGSFQMAEQWGSTPPTFLTFQNWQTNSHVLCSVTGKVHGGKKWFFHCSLSNLCQRNVKEMSPVHSTLIRKYVLYLNALFFPFSGFLLTDVAA